jgi:hypothetical protein
MPNFNELIQNIKRVRGYIREFFVFGWRSRSDFDEKSPRSYDNEKRRVASWLGDRLKEKRTKDGRSVFSISFAGDGYFDRNPLYEIWKTKTMTQYDISLLFFILDMLSRRRPPSDGAVPLSDIAKHIYGVPKYQQENIRNRLEEYVKNGILKRSKPGREPLYSLYPLSWKDIPDGLMDAVDFFTEAFPLGVIGSYIQDSAGRKNTVFRFNDDFFAATLDDEIFYKLTQAIRGRLSVDIDTEKREGGKWIIGKESAVPIKILESVESGRRYIAMKSGDNLIFRNLEIIYNVKPGQESADFYKYREELDGYLSKCWDVDFEREVDPNSLKPEHVRVKFAINANSDMQILRRLMDKCRNGVILPETPGVFVYRNELWNAREIIPFIMSFVGYVQSFTCDNKDVEKEFRDRLEKMQANYGGDAN